MKIVLQRVKRASVTVDGRVVGNIDAGLLVFLGVAKGDTSADADTLAKKLLELRIFEDGQGKMNLSIQEAGGDFLVVSQFTLYGNCDKGRRPSFDRAADPQTADELYQYFVNRLRASGATVATGVFAAMMDVELVNDGPVTFTLDSG